jgi:RHS repeat-associated protein
MSVPGQPGVSETGAYTYTVPIAVPPGTAGMAPSLSLLYSSQNGDGTLGLGWSLGGLSSITRCPRTIAEDTVHGGVNYDMNDRYCLDGQRLILISGTYGADGSQYRTEIESFREIIAHGSAGNGPAWFEVHLRTGQVLQYGDTTNSQILAVGKTTARAWAVNQITDTKGNYYTVTYTNDTTNGQYYPSRIDYTGNTSAALSTYNSVQFSYTTRSDIVPFYQAGSLQQTTVLLTDIKTYNGATLVFDYKLAYTAASSNASHDELASLTQCDGSSNCLAPTTFGWQGSRDVLTTTLTANAIAHGYGLLSGDFNGDGLTDALVLNAGCPTGGGIFPGTQSGSFSAGSLNAVYTYYEDHVGAVSYSGPVCFPTGSGTPSPGDFTGDGITDVLLNGLHWYYLAGDGSWDNTPYVDPLASDGTGNLNQSTSSTSIPQFVLFGDFNGDARIDGIDQNTGTTGYADLSNGDGTFTRDVGHSGLASGTLAAGDFDGDGCTDALNESGTATVYYFCNPATSSATVPSTSGYTIVTGDFNGDGKTDILTISASTTGKLQLSTGTGFVTTSFTVPTSWAAYQIVTGDFNGDGKTDIALISQTSGSPHLIYLSTGTGFELAASISNSDTAVTAVVADWNNDGADDIWLQRASGDAELLFSYTPELMTGASNGLGASVTMSYDRLNHATIYTKGSGATYPTQDLTGPYYVASQMSTSNGIGGAYVVKYAYTGAKTDVSRNYPNPGPRSNLLTTAFATFSTIAVTDQQTGIVRTTNFETGYPYYGQRSSQTTVSGTTTLQQVVNTMTSTNLGSSSPGGAYYFVSLQQSVVSGADLSGTALPTRTTSYTYDAYGNVLTKDLSVSDGSYLYTTNTYNNDTTDWFLGQLLTSQTQSIVGSSNLTRHFSFSYNSYNEQSQAVVEPGTSALSVTATFGYDAYGNRISTSLDGTGISAHASSVTFDSLGEFAITTTNALSQSDQWTHNAAFGETLSHTDPNSVVSSAGYDSFARQTLVTKPDGNKTAIAYSYCSGVNGGTASCPTYGATLAQSTPENSSGTQNGPATIAYYDALGRVIAGDTQGFDGSWIRVATQYDANGRVSQTSRPYFVSGGTAKWTAYTYDVLGRVTQATFPDSSKTLYGYNALVTSVTNDKSQVTTTTRNAQGLVAGVTDANSKTMSYGYDAFGDLTATTDPGGNVTSATYDLRGRKTAASDPDMGSWSYGYDVLSELTSQSDAKGQSTTLSYDLLGRPARRNEADLDSLWKYDTATNGVGKLTDACAASTCSTANYERSYVYDTLGRETRQALNIAGTSYHYDITYNSDGRVATLSYPSGFVAQYDYTSLGYLADIKDHSTGAAIWTANSADAELHLTQATAGNNVVTDNSFDANTGRLLNICATTSAGSCTGNVANLSYDWDTIGNLTDRADTYEGYTEEFCYDNLNRLVNYAIASTCTSSGDKTVAYDSLGDIASKSDVGTYTYPTSGSGSVRPHAVSSIAGTVNGVVNPTFTYDANGNMTAGDGRTVTYTSFNMAASVSEGTTTLGFVYDSEHRRYEQCLGGCTSPTTTTTYLYGPATSEKVVSGTTVTWNDYITANGALVAERTNYIGVISMAYFVADHLGSTSVLTNSSAAITERDSYDAFGKRRNANGTDNTACSITSATTRGYTGQEMMDSVCLTNMNARLYDQTIGRFQSADTIVQNGMNGQDFNRYSYVGNNPLAFIDPSGHGGVASRLGPEAQTKIVSPNGDVPNDDNAPPGTDGTPGIDSQGNPCSTPGVGDCTEFVEVDGQRTPTNVFGLVNMILGITPAEAAERGGDGRDQKNNDPKKPCSQTLMDIGNVGRMGGFAATGVGLTGVVLGFSGMAEGVPEIPVTDGASEIPGGAVTVGSAAFMSFGGYIDLAGAAMQGYAEGSSQPVEKPAEWAGVGALLGNGLLPVLGTVLGAGVGAAFSMADGPPEQLECP